MPLKPPARGPPVDHREAGSSASERVGLKRCRAYLVRSTRRTAPRPGARHPFPERKRESLRIVDAMLNRSNDTARSAPSVLLIPYLEYTSGQEGRQARSRYEVRTYARSALPSAGGADITYPSTGAWARSRRPILPLAPGPADYSPLGGARVTPRPSTPDPPASTFPGATLDAGRRNDTMTFQDAGWSSPVAREAHNLEVAGSNPVPAT